MHISRITEPSESPFALSEADFVFKEGRVQGARLGKNGGALLVEEAARFKLFTESVDLVKIFEGTGRFKWKKGETDFVAGDCFEVSEVGEYEINGSAKFMIIRK